MSDNKQYQAGMELRRSMWGEAGAESRVNAATAFNRPLEDLVTTWCFGDIWQRRNGFGGRVIEAVAGMDFETRRRRQRNSRNDPLPFMFRLGIFAVGDSVAPRAGMNFDHRRFQSSCHLDLR